MVDGENRARPALLGREKLLWDKQREYYVCPSGQTMPLKSITKERRSGGESVMSRLYGRPGAYCQACPLREKSRPNPSPGRIHCLAHNLWILGRHLRAQKVGGSEAPRHRLKSVET